MTSNFSNYRVRSKLEVFYTGGAVRVSNDGAVLACACGDEVKLVELNTGSVIQTFPGDSEPITSLAISTDGKTVFAASRSLQIKFWSVETGKTLRAFKGHKAPIADMAVDASGGMLATASADRTVRVWDIDGGYCTHSFGGHSGIILAVAFHPRELLLFTAGDDAQIKVWDLVTKSCVATLKSHFSAVTSLSLAPDGWTLLSGGRDGVVVAWDLRTYEKKSTVPVYEALEGVVALTPKTARALLGNKISTSKVSGDVNSTPPLCFATGGEKGAVKVWRLDTGTEIAVHNSEGGLVTSAGSIVELRALPHGAGLLAATQDCRLIAFDLTSPTPANPLPLHRQLIGNNDDVTDIRFVSNADTTTTATAAVPSSNDVTNSSLATGPSHIVVATNSEHIRLYDVATLGCSTTLVGHTDIVLSLDVVRLKSGVNLVASGSKDNTVRVWTVPDGKCIGVGSGHIAAVGAIAFSRKAQNFFVSGGSDKLLKVWDTSSLVLDDASPAKLRATATVAAHDKDVNAVAIAPNDSLVCTASQDRTVKVWQLPDLVLVSTLKGHKRGVWSVAFSPTDRVVATASGDKTLKLWSLQDATCLRTFEGHIASALRVNFLSASGGSQLISTGADGLLKLWSIRSSECINTFDAHEDKVWALAAANGGSLLASGGGDGSLALWEDCSSADEFDRLKLREEEVLKQQELMNALAGDDFRRAAGLALEMKRPGQLLKVVSGIIDRSSASLGGGIKINTAQTSDDSTTSLANPVLDDLVKGLDIESLKLSLEYTREWNTNGKTCAAAQAMLNSIFRVRSPKELAGIPGIGPILEGLVPYTQRHFSRLDRLLRSTFLVDYVLGTMNVLSLPTTENEEETTGVGNKGKKSVDDDVMTNGNGVSGDHHTSSSDDDDNNDKEKDESAEMNDDDDEEPVTAAKARKTETPVGRRTRARIAETAVKPPKKGSTGKKSKSTTKKRKI